MQDIIFTIHQDLIYILLHGEFFLESRSEELLQEIFHHRINIEYYFITLIQNDATLLYIRLKGASNLRHLTCHCRRICPRNNNLILLSLDPSCTGLFQDQKASWSKIKVEKAVSSKIEDNPSGG